MSQKKKNNAQNDTKQNNETQKKHNNNNENKNETQKKQKNNNNDNKNENKNNNKNENKNETKPTNVILKVDMHCEGCSSKIVKFIQGFEALNLLVEGFEKLDIGNGGKLTVTGTVDAGKLRDNLAIKMKKKVDFISPVPKKDKENNADNNNKKPEEKKPPKEPPVTMAVLKLELHCQGCTEKIRKTVLKTKGVQHVTIDKEKELVTVKGTMDMKVLVEKLKKRFKRKVEVVPTKKEKEKEKEKEKGENDGGNKKNNQKGGEGGGGGGGGKKKGEGNGGDNIAKKEVLTQPSYGYGYGNGYGYGGYFEFDEGYNYGQVQMMHIQEAPQMFSDENPNACSVM